jgi:ATP-binding cassette subfamily B protein
VDPQIQLWNEPLLDNLRYGLTDETPLEAGRVIEQANLSRVIQNLPAGLQSKLGEGGAQLSGGEGQRVRMGRACGKPGVRLTILDEPTRGLDRGQRDSFLQRAREIWQDATLLCITHDVASTRAFSRVLVIDHGQVVEDGDPAQLHANPDSRYRQLCDREEQVRKGLWSAALWRRFAMRDGALSEDVA